MSLRITAGLVFSLLALAACGGSSTATSSNSSSTPGAAASPAPMAVSGTAIEVRLSDFKIVPATLTAKAGVNTFDVRNDGPTPHNLTIKDMSGKTLGATRDLKPGEAATLSITLPAGSYTAICSLPGHASLGMKDTLTVG